VTGATAGHGHQQGDLVAVSELLVPVRMRAADERQRCVEPRSDRRLELAEVFHEGLHGGVRRQLDLKPASAGGRSKPGSESHLDVHRTSPRGSAAERSLAPVSPRGERGSAPICAALPTR
jgi:hypothetical protein